MLDVKNCGYDRVNNTSISVSRISGDDRYETNAKILSLFDKGYEENIVIAKDGMKDKSDLVDSLAVATLGYPVILGKDKISVSQVNAICDIVNDESNLIQVGYGIDDSVIDRLLDIVNNF